MLESYGVAPRESGKACAEFMGALALEAPRRRQLLDESTFAPSALPTTPLPTSLPTPCERDEDEGEGFSKFDTVSETARVAISHDRLGP